MSVYLIFITIPRGRSTIIIPILFSWPHPWHMEVPWPGTESEPDQFTAGSFNPLHWARDWTCASTATRSTAVRLPPTMPWQELLIIPILKIKQEFSCGLAGEGSSTVTAAACVTAVVQIWSLAGEIPVQPKKSTEIITHCNKFNNFIYLFILYFCYFFGPLPQHMEVPRLGV